MYDRVLPEPRLTDRRPAADAVPRCARVGPRISVQFRHAYQ